MKPEQSLGKHGRKLWTEITAQFDVVGVEPLLGELCALKDRLAEVREAIAAKGVVEAGKLLDTEVRLCGQFRQLWRAIGLGDRDSEPKRIGRPPGTGAGR
jgi:hypothetical protein